MATIARMKYQERAQYARSLLGKPVSVSYAARGHHPRTKQFDGTLIEIALDPSANETVLIFHPLHVTATWAILLRRLTRLQERWEPNDDQ